jgi:uridine phosphorylase
VILIFDILEGVGKNYNHKMVLKGPFLILSRLCMKSHNGGCMVLRVVLFIFLFIAQGGSCEEPIANVRAYLDYVARFGDLPSFSPPNVVLIFYQGGPFKHLVSRCSDKQAIGGIFQDQLYLVDNGRVGILGGFGIGAAPLAAKVEELIELGVKNFISVGMAGSLSPQFIPGDMVAVEKAYGEDGVSHFYHEKKSFVPCDKESMYAWQTFLQKQGKVSFPEAAAWSHSAFFQGETRESLVKVTKKGCSTVDMEASLLYSIGEYKKVSTLALFVISDSLANLTWDIHMRDPIVKGNLLMLAELALEFAKTHETYNHKSKQLE